MVKEVVLVLLGLPQTCPEGFVFPKAPKAPVGEAQPCGTALPLQAHTGIPTEIIFNYPLCSLGV